MALEITNDSVFYAVYDDSLLTAIKYGKDRVWPHKSNSGSGELWLDCDQEATMKLSDITGVEYAYKDEYWQTLTSNIFTFGGTKGPIYFRAKGKRARQFVELTDNRPPLYTAGGDPNAICDYTQMPTEMYCPKLFSYCQSLQDASELQFPEYFTQEKACFEMFEYCGNLIKAPQLPALILTKGCYEEMFRCCYKLETMPDLNAVNVPDYCYSCMFENTGITKITSIKAKTVGNRGMQLMFNKCRNLNGQYTFEIETTGYNACSMMFASCTSLEVSFDMHSIVSYGGYAFESLYAYCDKLIRLENLPKLIPSENAFVGVGRNCPLLEQVYFGLGNLSGNELAVALNTCPNVKQIHFLCDTPPDGEPSSPYWAYVFSGYLINSDQHVVDVYLNKNVKQRENLEKYIVNKKAGQIVNFYYV